MKSPLLGAVCVGLFSVITTPANATLWNRGSEMVYDDVLGITWLRNANLIAGSSYDVGPSTTDGRTTWDSATAWVQSLSIGGYDDWRLPTVLPVNGSGFDLSDSFDGSTDFAYNISALDSAHPNSTASELAYMFYVNFGNEGWYDISGALTGCSELISPPYCLTNTSFESGGPGGTLSSFQNVQANSYWTDTDSDYGRDYKWRFVADRGRQDWIIKTNHNVYVWAVRDGDVSTVPIPASVWLFGSGLIGLVMMARRKASPRGDH